MHKLFIHKHQSFQSCLKYTKYIHSSLLLNNFLKKTYGGKVLNKYPIAAKKYYVFEDILMCSQYINIAINDLFELKCVACFINL